MTITMMMDGAGSVGVYFKLDKVRQRREIKLM